MTPAAASKLIVLSILATGCASLDSNEPAPSSLWAQYHEKIADTNHLVAVDLDDCHIVVSRGPFDHLENASATCTATEQATGKRLLAEAIWETYERADSSAWGYGDAGGAGAGGVGGAGGAGAKGDGGSRGASWETDDDLPAGLVAVTRSGENGSGTKIFAGDSTGPESELIEYLRQLYEKYGQFE